MSSETQSDMQFDSTPGEHPHNRWLVLISAFKLLQALFFLAIAAGAFHFLHKDIDEELDRIARLLLMNPETRAVNYIIEKASLLDDLWIKRLVTLFSLYAILDLIEGVGLYFERVWAEYLTLIVTGSFMPWEIYEIVRHVTAPKLLIFAFNLVVFLYLLRLVAEAGRRRSAAGIGAGPQED